MRHLPHRSAIVCILAVCLLVGPLQGGSIHGQDMRARVGLIAFGDSGLQGRLEQPLIEGLRQRGYVEGRNLVFERRYADGRPERMAQIATELADLKLDVILTTCSPTTRIMSDAAQNTPLVMIGVSDPVGQGLIASLSRPGGSITGLSSQFDEVAAKMIQLLREAVPDISRIAVIFNPMSPAHKTLRGEMEAAAQVVKLQVTPLAVGQASDLPLASDEISRRGLGAIMVLPDDPLLLNLRRGLIEIAAQNRVPSFFGHRETVEDGGLMSYGLSLRWSYARAVDYLDRILRGASPAALPVEQPTRFELAVNLKTARALGLAIPPAILARADEVIE